jgi:hypothetical protein
MLCSNRTSSCDFLAERPSRAGRLSELRFVWWKRAAANSQIAIETWSCAPVSHGIDRWPRHLPAPSLPLPRFAIPFRSRKHRVSARATVQLVQKILPPSCAQAPGKALVPGLLSTLFRTALSTANTGARGRCLDIDYCTISPCSARSRPSRSTSCVTRRPTAILTTKRMIKLATAS